MVHEFSAPRAYRTSQSQVCGGGVRTGCTSPYCPVRSVPDIEDACPRPDLVQFVQRVWRFRDENTRRIRARSVTEDGELFSIDFPWGKRNRGRSLPRRDIVRKQTYARLIKIWAGECRESGLTLP